VPVFNSVKAIIPSGEVITTLNPARKPVVQELFLVPANQRKRRPGTFTIYPHGCRAAMTANIFLLSTPVTLERLSWIEECLKFFFVQLYPETLMHQAKGESPVFSFLMTGDALYSLDDPETQQVWTIILSLSTVRLICDRQELDLRGISAGQLKMKFPDQVITTNSIGTDGQPSFWNDAVALARQTKPPLPGTVGWFQCESPYMHRSAWHGLRFLSAALTDRLAIDLYAYLDGVHIGHIGQAPTESENIGAGIEELGERAARHGLPCQVIACNRNATARGYSTADDGQGVVISTCAIKPVKIRDLNVMIDRFRQNHVILSANAGSLVFRKGASPSFDRAEKRSTAPPVTILITKSPYSTEMVFGAVSLAVACAHAGILTRVIFIEDGVYALTGTHRTPANSPPYNLQDVINAVAGSVNLHFFAFTPSFQKRGTSKDKSLKAVLELGYPGLGKVLFYPPGNVQAEHQRVLIF
jgi:tRNA 2-thiouridine synthesizing protein C